MKAQDVIAVAIPTLNDKDSQNPRYDPDDLLMYVNNGLDDLFDLRPDLFVGNILVIADGADYKIDDDLPLPGRWKRTLADYVIFRAEMAEDEHVNSGRAKLASDFWQSRLL